MDTKKPAEDASKIASHRLSYAECSCAAVHKVNRMFSWAAVPEQYAPGGFESFEKEVQPRAYAVAKKWLECQEDWLYYSGGVGTGKTHLVTAIVRELRKQAVPSVIVSVPNMLDLLRPKQSGETKHFKQILTVKVLALDDIGAQRNSDWVTEQMFKLIDYRSMHKLATIMTSNETLDSLSSSAPGWSRIADRIAEHAVLVAMKEGSYRIKQGRERAAKYSNC
jgi:DNA replication protein DnaC